MPRIVGRVRKPGTDRFRRLDDNDVSLFVRESPSDMHCRHGAGGTAADNGDADGVCHFELGP